MSFQYRKRDEGKSYILFHVETTTNKFLDYGEMLLKSFWTGHLQMDQNPYSRIELVAEREYQKV